MFIWGSNPHPSASSCRGVAQLVAHTAGGREVASSSLVTPTKLVIISWMILPGWVRPVADSPSPEPTADEVASSSLVTPTKLVIIIGEILLSQ